MQRIILSLLIILILIVFSLTGCAITPDFKPFNAEQCAGKFCGGKDKYNN